MGREIRRVPADWQHPINAEHPTWPSGETRYIPLYDDDYENASCKWMEAMKRWEAMEGDEGVWRMKHKGESYCGRFYWEYAGNPPNAESYRDRKWTPEEATCYQIYETVSEGTPTSPVFKTLDEMEKWLIEDGYSPEAAKAFCVGGYVPSAVFANGKMYEGIESASID